MNKEISLIDYKKEIRDFIATKENLNLLIQTTFKGLSQQNVEQAMLEGMMRGFTIKDFLEKNVYAVSFGGGYSLVTSIDFARKVGMKNGVVGVSAPEYEISDTGVIESCTITVKRKIDDYIGDFSAKVFFSEYTTGKNLWASKPKTMIAKVAELHALRKACPEDLSQMYVEEEFEKQNIIEVLGEDVSEISNKIREISDIDELKTFYKEKVEGKGATLTKLITQRKKEIESIDSETELNPEDYPLPDKK